MLIDISTTVIVIDPSSYVRGLAVVILKRAPDDGVSDIGELMPIDQLDGPPKRQVFLLRPREGEGHATFRIGTSIMKDQQLSNRHTWAFTMSRRATMWDLMLYRPQGGGGAGGNFHRVFLPDYDPLAHFERGQTAWDRIMGENTL